MICLLSLLLILLVGLKVPITMTYGSMTGASSDLVGETHPTMFNSHPNFNKIPYQNTINQASQRYMIDPNFYKSLLWQESMGDPTAYNPDSQAYGLAQINPVTAKQLGINPRDPYENITGGARYLGQLQEEFHTPELTLAAYNAGPGRVRQAMGVPNIPETQNYIKSILGMLRK